MYTANDAIEQRANEIWSGVRRKMVAENAQDTTPVISVLLLTGQATVSHVDRPSVESRSCLRRDDTAGSRDIVFLPRHELRNKITTRNWNYPRITIVPSYLDRRLSVY